MVWFSDSSSVYEIEQGWVNRNVCKQCQVENTPVVPECALQGQGTEHGRNTCLQISSRVMVLGHQQIKMIATKSFICGLKVSNNVSCTRLCYLAPNLAWGGGVCTSSIDVNNTELRQGRCVMVKSKTKTNIICVISVPDGTNFRKFDELCKLCYDKSLALCSIFTEWFHTHFLSELIKAGMVTYVYSISQEICTRSCCALLCCGYAIVDNEFTWSIYPYSSGLLCWHWGNR